MAGTPSMGDVLMLSHTAKSIGKAFGIKAVGVPQDFFEVERETLGLADALKLLAYILEEDETILHAPENVQQAIFTVLASAQVTLRDLAAFVERYSTFTRGKPGVSGEKTWSKGVLTDWTTLPWTRDGGDMTALRSLLMMHCTTITMTTQAVQGRSAERLSSTVLPLAEKLEDIHEDIPGRLNQQLEELHFICMTIMHEQRTLAIATRNELFSPQVQDFDMPTPVSPMANQSLSDLGLPSLQQVETLTSAPVVGSRSTRHDRSESLTQLYVERDTEGWKVRKRSSSQYSAADVEPQARPRSQLVDPNIRSKRSKSADGPPKSRFPRFARDSTASPMPSINTDFSDTESQRAPPTPRRLQKRRPPPSKRKSMPLPDSIDFEVHGRNDLTRVDSRASAVFDDMPEEGPPRLPTPPRSRSGTDTLLDSLPSEADFMENLLRGSVKMFDERGRLVEALSSEPRTLKSTSSINTIISKACRILVLRRKSEPGIGGVWNTSIWIIASDFSVRLEQPLQMTLQPRAIAPHIAVKLPERVALTLPCKIQYHTPVWGCTTESSGTTLLAERVTYTFLSAQAASRFQSVIFGQQLLDSFCIERATVIRPGGSGKSFFYKMLGTEEQICGQQRIRLWEDHGDVTPSNTAGGVLGLMHVQPSFGQGWVKWWVNSSRVSQIKNKSNGVVEIRGIDCLVTKPSSRPLKAVDNFTQCSLLAGVPVSAFDAPSSHVSSERPSTSMSNREEMRSRHSPSPSFNTPRQTEEAPPLPHIDPLRAHNPRSRTSESRSRSGSRSRTETTTPVPADPSEPVPAVRSDSALMAATTRSSSTPSKHSRKLSGSRSATTLNLPPPPTLGKWDNPISPRNFRSRKSADTPRTPSHLTSDSVRLSSPPMPTPSSAPQVRATSRAESRLDYRSESRAAARDFDSMSFVSQRSKATTTISTRSKAKSWRGGKSRDHRFTKEPKEEKKRSVYGIKIYFSTDDDKRRFLTHVAKAREKSLALPDF
ncbi:hypothetical protein BDZ85DRAFT_248915 [Elsinoe ampelina]|uniref:Uncharacterized protein n=1 Tax=Elsinoe ampelina TaxID=302913 RepID=A0A6A6GEQ6_9PEZI|nr:hypothetical protein BDZ85DRAFT_248915 [Elsinoe ampelina]